MPAPELLDSRRLPGVNLLHDGPGAVLDVRCEDAETARLVSHWTRHLRRVLRAVGWRGTVLRHRRFAGGVSLFFSAPIDGLYAATEINEWALDAATRDLTGARPRALGAAARRLRALIALEAEPSLTRMAAAARRHHVAFHLDHHGVSVGCGAGSRFWPAENPQHPVAPPVRSVDWSTVHDVPQVLVTGSNGKTTSVRLMGAIARAWGRVPGYSTTDNIVVGAEVLDSGDWSGPMGSRQVLRDSRVEVAVLETARGGILRRGLAVTRADAALVTNVAVDHFGEWGITDLRGIAATKLVVGHVVPRLVVNAEDPVLMDVLAAEQAAGRIRADVGLFALDPAAVRGHLRHGGTAAVLERGDLVFHHGRRRWHVMAASDAPVTLGGAARYNVANVLGVILLASAIGIPKHAIVRGLGAFHGSPRDNPGRSHLCRVGGVSIIVDFAHNPHGMRALVETARGLEAERRLLLLGQAGDRDDESIRALAREAWALGPDRVVLKEMEKYRRGRPRGEATGLIRAELAALGAPAGLCVDADSELDGVRAALAWARPGDLLVLPCHAQRDEVLALIDRLADADWRPGHPLPD